MSILLFLSLYMALAAAAPPAEEPCVRITTSADVDYLIYRGSRRAALKKVETEGEKYEAAAERYFLRHSDFNRFRKKLSGDKVDWQTPTERWSASSLNIEYHDKQSECAVILDDNRIYSRKTSSEGFLQRRISMWEHESIEKDLLLIRTVY